MGAPAAWLADPTRRHQLRYWDGAAWTDHVSDGGVQGTDPVAGGGAPQQTSTSQRWMDKAKQFGQQAAASASAAVDSAADTWNSQTKPNPTSAQPQAPVGTAAPTVAGAPVAGGAVTGGTPAGGAPAVGGNPAVATPTAETAAEEASVADQLHKLAELRDRGILTEEEFQSQKAKILGG